jgi:PAS domain S-box-containing protein
VVVEEVDPQSSRAPASSVGFVESLLDGLPNPLFVKDERHRWVLLNAAMGEFMGHPRHELIGKSDFDFFPPEEARVFWEKDDLVFAYGGINENEERFTDAAGETHIIVTRKTIHRDAQGRRFLLGVITDITALRRATEQLRASRDELEDRVRERTAQLSSANALLREHDAERAAFLNVLGHELRNPISAISASSAILARRPPGSQEVTRAHAIIGRQVGHLSRLCDDLLDVARLARGKLEIHRETLDLGRVVEDLCEDHRTAFERRGIELSFEQSGGETWIDADETRLAQSIGNVLHNAMKFTPSGGRVEVTVGRSQDRARVTVRDTGVGVPPEQIERLFEPFTQADGGGARQGGLGIGLAIARGLVEAHGGEIEARSEGPGSGFELTVLLPLAAQPARPAEREARPSPSRDLSIVLIEDDRDVRDSLADLLRSEGYRVSVAPDAGSGVALARSLHPDAILCDLGLPDADGCEVARRIRSDPDDAVARSRLIALSGFARPEDVQRAHAAGFDAHLPKPPSLRAVEALVARPAGASR